MRGEKEKRKRWRGGRKRRESGGEVGVRFERERLEGEVGRRGAGEENTCKILTP